ncbi:MAG: TylF/MycF family methyltransferase [Micrococcales bacterium]|nr:TylF/MycF family methyltransferase [Micrococcales bacterium]
MSCDAQNSAGRAAQPTVLEKQSAVLEKLTMVLEEQTALLERRSAGVAKPTTEAAIDLPRDYDEAAKATIREVKPWTMTSPEKLNALVLAIRHVVAHGISGDVVECGVWRGGSMQAAARTLIEAGDTSRDLYLFDTFEGMSAPSDKDRRLHDGAPAAELLDRHAKTSPVWAVASVDDVKDGMARIGYPAERIHYVQGKVEDTVPEEAPESISILRLDTDWYESTKHELEQLYPRLVSGRCSCSTTTAGGKVPSGRSTSGWLRPGNVYSCCGWARVGSPSNPEGTAVHPPRERKDVP